MEENHLIKLLHHDRRLFINMMLSYDLYDIINLCHSSDELKNNICKNDVFWKLKINNDYGEYGHTGLTVEKTVDKKLTYKLYYYILHEFGEAKDLNKSFMRAFRDKDIKTVKVLLNDSRVNINMDKYGNSPLRIAGKYYPSILKLLLEKGVNVNQTGGIGYTPLIDAIASDNEVVVQLLLEHGADPNLAAINGITPLGMSSRPGNINIIRLLLESGANPNDTENLSDLFNPLYQARENKRNDIVELLLKYGAV